jgi:GNAT superfamily N-acetyltransferase
MNIEIMHANIKHRDFLIQANKIIDEVNNMEQYTEFEKHINDDYYCEDPKFKCLVAEVDGEPVGMILYSYFYWASDGQVLWISQMYIKEEYRKYGIFFKLINRLREENKNISIVSFATGIENFRMQKIIQYYGGHEMNKLKFYYKEI